MSLRFLDRCGDVGLLVIRVGVGLMFVGHGGSKLLEGPDKWTHTGGALSNFGITFWPVVWGLLAALAESVGGLLLALGLFARVASLFPLGVMVVAATMHISEGDEFKIYSHAVEAGFVFLGLFLTGPGRLSLDHALWPREPKPELPAEEQ